LTSKSFISAVDTLVPSVFDLFLTKGEIAQEITLEAGGTVPVEEQTALAPFNLTAQEYGVIQSHFAQVSDSAGAVDAYFSALGASTANSITARQALTDGYALVCVECQTIPEPSTCFLFATRLGVLVGYGWRRHERKV
jgi:hypothetical protein